MAQRGDRIDGDGPVGGEWRDRAGCRRHGGGGRSARPPGYRVASARRPGSSPGTGLGSVRPDVGRDHGRPDPRRRLLHRGALGHVRRRRRRHLDPRDPRPRRHEPRGRRQHAAVDHPVVDLGIAAVLRDGLVHRRVALVTGLAGVRRRPRSARSRPTPSRAAARADDAHRGTDGLHRVPDRIDGRVRRPRPSAATSSRTTVSSCSSASACWPDCSRDSSASAAAS